MEEQLSLFVRDLEMIKVVIKRGRGMEFIWEEKIRFLIKFI
jgi:hypothetical protein